MDPSGLIIVGIFGDATFKINTGFIISGIVKPIIGWEKLLYHMIFNVELFRWGRKYQEKNEILQD